ncbi:MAG: O-methyltransferase [Saprospiraceae bacterium]
MIDKTTQYAESHTTTENEILRELRRETYIKMLQPQMISGQIQGQLLTFFSQMLQPKVILEIGTFTGYAAICLAQGLVENGIMHTIEVNEENETIIRKYLTKARLTNKVNLHIGDAVEILPTLSETFDLVFIDAGKKHNALYYDMIFNQVRQGGFIITDNVLWGGKVAENATDKRTRLIDSFNKKIQEDERVENLLLPIRDGLMIVRKR